MQIDFDAFEFARTSNWQDPAANIRSGCQVLAQGRDFLERKAHLADRALLQAAIAGCNAGPGNAIRALQDGLDSDFFTANNVSNSASQLLQCHDDAPDQLIDGVNASPSREVARLDVGSAIPLALMCQLRTFLRQSLLPSFNPSLRS
jgi:hypothetical protein